MPHAAPSPAPQSRKVQWIRAVCVVAVAEVAASLLEDCLAALDEHKPREATMGRTTTDGGTKRVLVMGATGFVGRALVPALVEAGYEVRAATRNPARVASFPHIEWIQCDVNQRRDVERALQGVDALFFLVH